METARELLINNEYSLVVVKRGGVIATSRGMGIRPLFETLQRVGSKMSGSSIADKVIGKAAAMLCVLAEVDSVYTPAISKKALLVLEENQINIEFDKLVDAIMNKDFSGLCPLEKMADEMISPVQSNVLIKRFLEGNGKGQRD